jgi:hypothetical protein
VKEVRQLFTAAEAARALGIPAGSVRAWRSCGRLVVWGFDERGNPMYDRDDLVALRDGTRRNVCRAPRRRKPRLPKLIEDLLDNSRVDS